MNTDGIDVKGAEQVYLQFVETSDAALADPKQDWSIKIRKFAVDPAASAILANVQLLATNNFHVTGHSSYQARLANAAPTRVDLVVCIDNRGQDIVDENGRSVKAGSGGRHPQNVVLAKTDSGPWRVSQVIGNPKASC